MSESIFELSCPAQDYAWGKIGTDSVVAQLKEQDKDFTVEAGHPYAELWMGTHQNGPASAGGKPLIDVIKADAKMVENYPAEYAGFRTTGELPYLFKILSVGKALSIQAHPDKKLAEKIHSERPTIYKDPNHKPEMALAITPMEALCQFRPLSEVAVHLTSSPEFRAMVGEEAATGVEVAAKSRADNTDAGKDALKATFSAFMTCPEEKVQENLTPLIARLSEVDWSMRTPTESLLLRCNEQFPGDIGCFCPFFLNYITLQPGEAIFLAANEPHAYLSGDLAECMACSDNVIRSGLTPKFKDVELLCSCLTYSTGRAPVNYGAQIDERTKLYSPPVPEFEMLNTQLPPSTAYTLPANKTPLIMLVIDGGGTVGGQAVVKGSIYFAVPGTEVPLQSGEAGLTMYSARCNESNM